MARARGAPRALFCDTNVLVRLLTGDPPSKAAAARAALDRAADHGVRIWLPDVVVAELAYVLTSVYELGVAEAAGLLGRILDLPGVEVADEPLLRDALLLWEETRLDFTDSYLAALGRGVEGAGVLSFDRGFDRAEGVVRIDPAALGS